MSATAWPWLLTGIRRSDGGHDAELFIYAEALYEFEVPEVARKGPLPRTDLLLIQGDSWRHSGMPPHQRRLLHLAARTTSERLARRVGGLRVPHLGVTAARLEPAPNAMWLTLTLDSGEISYDLRPRTDEVAGHLARLLHRLYGARFTTPITATDDPRQVDPVPAGAPRSVSGQRYWDGHVWAPTSALG